MTEFLDPANLDLARYLRRGDAIVWGQACAEPSTLVETLGAQAGDIGDISAFVASSFASTLTPDFARAFRMKSMGTIGTLRPLASEGLLDIIPLHVGQIGPMISDGQIGCDVAFVQVSPADAQGRHSYGLSHDSMHKAVAKARVVIAEVNDRVPFTLGEHWLTANDIDCAIHVSRDLAELRPGALGETDMAIAAHVAGFISDGVTIQMGVGGVPDAVMRLLGDRRDLGVHSGMVSDSLVDLVEAGVVTNARKLTDKGISITGILAGTRRLYDWAHNNPALAMRDAATTHGEAALTAVSGLVTINSAIEVDLTGQVNAEQSGSAYLGGTGGQVDYVRGGSRSPGGRSIIALPATAKGGTLSRIVPALSGPVTTARSEVDVIVTEFGAAELKGQSLPERAKRMVHIAHPDFRETLDQTAFQIEKRGF